MRFVNTMFNPKFDSTLPRVAMTGLADWEQADTKRVAGRCESVYA
jgi:hypothetical protein